MSVCSILFIPGQHGALHVLTLSIPCGSYQTNCIKKRKTPDDYKRSQTQNDYNNEQHLIINRTSSNPFISIVVFSPHISHKFPQPIYLLYHVCSQELVTSYT